MPRRGIMVAVTDIREPSLPPIQVKAMAVGESPARGAGVRNSARSSKVAAIRQAAATGRTPTGGGVRSPEKGKKPLGKIEAEFLGFGRQAVILQYDDGIYAKHGAEVVKLTDAQLDVLRKMLDRERLLGLRQTAGTRHDPAPALLDQRLASAQKRQEALDHLLAGKPASREPATGVTSRP
jgi:hypothetical protein